MDLDLDPVINLGPKRGSIPEIFGPCLLVNQAIVVDCDAGHAAKFQVSKKAQGDQHRPN